MLIAHEAETYEGVPAHQLDILYHWGLSVEMDSERAVLPLADLIIDALIGYSLQGAPSGQFAQLICRANLHAAPVLSLDIPSGVEATSGATFKPHIQATATPTLALPKTGLLTDEGRPCVGELYLADIERD